MRVKHQRGEGFDATECPGMWWGGGLVHRKMEFGSTRNNDASRSIISSILTILCAKMLCIPFPFSLGYYAMQLTQASVDYSGNSGHTL